MARTKAISLIQSGSTKADLAELSGLVIANIQKDTLAQGLKSQAYTGNPASGSVEFKRFKNSASQPYGTARIANKGTAITVPPTPVNLDTHREIVEEAAKFDLDTFGVTNIMARRADTHVDTVAAEFDAAFFQTAFDAGTAYTPDASATIEEILEGLIQSVETVKNDYVRGVPRNLIRLVLDPVTYGKARNYLDKNTNNVNVDTAAEDFAMFSAPIMRVLVTVLSPLNLLFRQLKKLLSMVFHGDEDDGILRELLAVGKGVQRRGGSGIFAGQGRVAAQDGAQLLARDGRAGLEARRGHAGDDALPYLVGNLFELFVAHCAFLSSSLDKMRTAPKVIPTQPQCTYVIHYAGN